MITAQQEVERAICAAMSSTRCPAFEKWAISWLTGRDRLDSTVAALPSVSTDAAAFSAYLSTAHVLHKKGQTSSAHFCEALAVDWARTASGTASKINYQ